MHFIALQEPQLSDSSKLKAHTFWGRSKLEADYVNATGRSGGLLSVWDPTVLAKRAVTKHRYFLAIHGDMVGSQSPISIINVYGPQDTREKRDLWDILLSYMSNTPGMFLLLGDFKIVRYPEE